MSNPTRFETLASPVELCATCPDRGECVGPATGVVDIYLKASFFCLEMPEGDPEFFAGRRYVDSNGGESELFLNEDAELVNNCEKPEVVKRHLFRPDELACHVNQEKKRSIAENNRLAAKIWDAEIAKRVYLTLEETRALSKLPDSEMRDLISLPIAELNKLVLFAREHPEEIDSLKSLKY